MEKPIGDSIDVVRLGRFMRTRRQAAQFTVERLATDAGITPGTVSKLERGLVESPNLRHLAGIGRALDLSLGELLAEAGLGGADVLPDVAYYLRVKLGLPDIAVPDAIKHLSDLQTSVGKKRRR